MYQVHAYSALIVPLAVFNNHPWIEMTMKTILQKRNLLKFGDRADIASLQHQ